MTDTRRSTMYEHVGGREGLHRLVAEWYRTVLDDPLLQPLFGQGHADHVPHLTAFLAEVFGGPADYTRQHGGFPALLAPHRGKRIHEDQRRRFIELFVQAADRTRFPTDVRTRTALTGYLEFGTRVAMQNSHAATDEELHPCQEVPRWDW
jgi:hemoglobin